MLNKRFYTFLILIFVLFFSVRLVGLGKDILNSDGPRWYRRSSQFLEALKSENYKDTYQHYQPGVTLMWIRAFVENYSDLIREKLGKPQWYMENYAYFINIHKVTKSVLVAVLGVLLLYQILIIKNIFGDKLALIYGLLVSFEPYLAGIDRWFHLTSLESYFAFSSFLTLLYWYKVFVENKGETHEENKSEGSNCKKRILETKGFYLLILSAVFLSLSILSKVIGIISVVPLAVIFYSGYRKREDFSSKLNYLKYLLVFVVGFVISCYVFFPALWENSSFILNTLFNEMTKASGVSETRTLLSTARDFTYYVDIILFKMSPITVVVFIFAFCSLILRKKEFVFYKHGNILIYLLSFFILLSFSEKRIDRYSIEFFLPVILLVSLYLDRLKIRTLAIVLLGSFLVLIYSLINNFPVLSGFYSPIFGGENKAIELGLYDNSGEYLAQAALYLNKYERSRVFIENNFETFKFFSKHEIQGVSDAPDYSIFSLDVERSVAPAYHCGYLEKAFGPRFERPVVFVYKCD